jgi:hypothetical protein
MKKILIILGSIVVIGGLLWFGLSYWIGGSIGGGGMQQYAPDTVQAGEPADITIIATATGGGGYIQGRFTDLTLHYRLVGENVYKSIPSQSIALPDNFNTVQSKTFQSEAYKFTIPAYPKSTTGEIEYYVEMTFDGYPSKTDGVKKIKVSESVADISANYLFKTWDDGTAYVEGNVIDHVSGCEVDGACKLIVQTGNQRVALVYTEGDLECLNIQAASWVKWGQNVNKGTAVKAYGAYNKLGSEERITFCGSKDYFILGADDQVPMGAYTEKLLMR